MRIRTIASELNRPIKLCFSYVKEDDPIRTKIEKHFSALCKSGTAITWHSDKIPPGGEVDSAEMKAILEADIILLLVSSDYVSVDRLWEKDWQLALQRQELGRALVVPVLARPFNGMDLTPLRGLVSIPFNGLPLSSWESLDDALSKMVNDMIDLIEGWFHNRKIAPLIQAVETWHLTLEESWDNFSKNRQEKIVRALWELTGDHWLRVTAKSSGSVRLTLVGRPGTCSKVKDAYENGQLDNYLSCRVLAISEAIGASVRFGTQEAPPGTEPEEIQLFLEPLKGNSGILPPLVTGFSYLTQKPFPPGFEIGHHPTHRPDENEIDELNRRLGEYFSTFMVVRGEYLNVDLNPYKDYCGITEPLRKTRLGWDLLQQDFELKLFVAKLLHPGHETGALFWDEILKLGLSPDGDISSCFQVWIVPGNVSVHQGGEGDRGVVEIQRFDMKVQCQIDYLTAQKFALASHMPGNLGPSPLAEACLDAFKRIILPEVVKEVNQGPTFGLLRQIYTVLICAKWYMNQIGDRMPYYIGTNDVEKYGLNVIQEPPSDIQANYRRLFEEGLWETVLPWPDQQKSQIVLRHFVAGRVDFGPPVHWHFGPKTGKFGHKKIL